MMAWWKRDRLVMSCQSIGTDNDVHSVVTSPGKPDGWDTMVADMAADAQRRRAAQVVADKHRAAHGALYLHYLADATEALDAKKYQATSAYSALAQVHLGAWQHGTPAPQTADAPAPDHEKHTQQEQK